MNRAEHFHFADFTTANYRRLLRLAKGRYVFRLFDRFAKDENFVLWRHDVDFSVHAAARLASIEQEEDVRATYFVHFHNEFYNLLERATWRRLLTIVSRNHEIGLHFDPHFYEGEPRERIVLERLPKERELLESLLGRPVTVFSFHRPAEWMLELQEFTCGGMINTYAEYFRRDVGYCSDSNGYWRHERLEDVLLSGKHPRLQVLTHPNWWQESVMSPHERIERAISGRAENTRRAYLQVLKDSGRDDVDW